MGGGEEGAGLLFLSSSYMIAFNTSKIFRPLALVSACASFVHCCAAFSTRSRKSLSIADGVFPFFLFLSFPPKEEEGEADSHTNTQRSTRLATLLLPAGFLWAAKGKKASSTFVVWWVGGWVNG